MIERDPATFRDPLGLARAYLLAKRQVIAHGYEREIAWQEEASLRQVTPTVFVQEAAWVVLCAGMRESVVRDRFPQLGEAFEHWAPERIAHRTASCRRRALRLFNHAAKIDAIVDIAIDVAFRGVEPFLRGLEAEGPTFLSRLPFIGDVTCFHLAKNLGFATAKPDRHLQRIARALGFTGAQNLCETIAGVLAEPVQVVDVVMWRFATIEHGYVSWLERALSATERCERPSEISYAS